MLVALCLCKEKLQPYAEPTIASQAVSLKKENSTPKSSSPCTGFVAGQLERALVIHQGVKARWMRRQATRAPSAVYPSPARSPREGAHQMRTCPGSKFTLLFERLAIDWVREAAVTAVARQLKLGWDAVWGHRAPRGRARPGTPRDA